MDKLKNELEKRFPRFGVNKTREIVRLVFEISKIEKNAPEEILNSLNEANYEKLKKTLLAKRYPKTFNAEKLKSFYLPKLDIDESLKADISDKPFYPKNIYYEKKAENSFIFQQAKNLFPNANFTEIESLKSFTKNKAYIAKKLNIVSLNKGQPLSRDFVPPSTTFHPHPSSLSLKYGEGNMKTSFLFSARGEGKGNHSIKDFNNRCDNLFLVKEKYDFFKRCPCTSSVVNCGYSIMNLGMGCPYECSYCFLQAYQNAPGIILPYNIDDYLQDDKIVSSTQGFFNYKRIGSGEFTDSLVFDHITEFSKPIIEFFKKRNDISFEFKTKSININNLLERGGQKNIVAAWSVNTLKMRLENEFKTPDISQRLNAAKTCAKAGFSTAFHFDPIIHYDDWKEGYKETVDMIFDIIPNESIKWISLGTLRMPAAQKTVMENRFPDNEALNGELLLGRDYKLRYDKELRIEIYRYINELIQSKKSNCVVYLCMEETEVWKRVELGCGRGVSAGRGS